MIDNELAPLVPTGPSTSPPQRRAWGVTALLVAFMVVNFADKSVLGLAADPIRHDLGLSATDFGLANSAFFLLFSLSGGAMGLLADRLRPRRLLLVLAAVWSASQLPMALGAGFTLLVASRIVLGAAEGPAFPIAQHTAFTWFPDRRRNLPGALISMGTTLGVVVAAPTLTWVVGHHGWRSAFGTVAVAGVLWAVLWSCFGREGALPATGTGTATGTATATVPGAPPKAGPEAASEADALSQAPVVVSYRRILGTRTWIGITAAYFSTYWAAALTLVWLPSYLHDGLGYPSASAAGVIALVWAATGCVMLAQAGVTGRLLRRGVPSRWARAGVGGVALLVAALGCLGLSGAHRGPVAVALLVAGFGLAGVMVNISVTTVAEFVPAGRRAGALGLTSAVATTAGLIAPTLTGALVDMQGVAGYRHAVLLTGVLLLLGGLAALLLVDPARDAFRLRTRSSREQAVGVRRCRAAARR